MVDQLCYFSFQPVLNDWYVLSCQWDGVYERDLAVNRKE